MSFTPSERSPVVSSLEKGFTLIEIIVVIAVIAVLASVVSPMVFQNVSDAKQTTARSQIEVFSLALDSYRLDNDRYPSTEDGLAALRVQPLDSLVTRNWRGPYLRREVPMDPWGRPYVYRYPGEENPTSFDLLTLGRDGLPGGEGEDSDITSWN